MIFRKITRGRGWRVYMHKCYKHFNIQGHIKKTLVKICHTEMHLRFFAPTILQMVDAKNVHRLI